MNIKYYVLIGKFPKIVDTTEHRGHTSHNIITGTYVFIVYLCMTVYRQR